MRFCKKLCKEDTFGNVYKVFLPEMRRGLDFLAQNVYNLSKNTE